MLKKLAKKVSRLPVIPQMLLEKLSEIDFENLNVDELLDNRDSEPFDNEWSRVYREVGNLKKEKGFTTEQKKYSSNVSENNHIFGEQL